MCHAGFCLRFWVWAFRWVQREPRLHLVDIPVVGREPCEGRECAQNKMLAIVIFFWVWQLQCPWLGFTSMLSVI